MKDKQNLLEIIISEATNVFLEKGYKNLNVDELVDQIGISKATFYKYIPSKEFLFEECIRRYLEKFKKGIRSQINRILKSNKETFFPFFMDIIKISNNFLATITTLISPRVEKRFPQIRVKLQELTKKQIESSFYSIIKKGRELGLIKKDIDDEVLYFIIYTTLTHLKSFIHRQNKEFTLENFFKNYFFILFNGILVNEIKNLYYPQVLSHSYEK